MKTKFLFCFFFFLMSLASIQAQESYKYFHVGLEATPGSGVGVAASATFDVAENVAVGPIAILKVGIDSDLWYNYVVGYLGIGVKGEYYFDDLLSLPKDFDVYAGGQAGFFFTPRSSTSDYTVGYLPPPESRLGRPFVAAMVGGRWHWQKNKSLFVEVIGGAFHSSGGRAGLALKF